MSKINTDELLSSVNIVGVIGSHIELNKKGTEHYGICPFHNDTHESLQINEAKQIYKCFSCGAGGDAIDFLMRGGMSFHDATEALGGKKAEWAPSPVQKTKATKTNTDIIQPVPSNAPEPPNKFSVKDKSGAWVKQRFIARWTYKDAAGAVLGHVVRFHDVDGSKNLIPQMYVRNEAKNREEWKWLGFPVPRPIYGLDILAKNPDKTVLIVEGEKAADHARKLFSHVVVISWQGATSGIHNVDWSPIYGRKVIFWPDNDEPGVTAAEWFHKNLRQHLAVLKFVNPPQGTPKGWDIADATWKADKALEYIRSNLSADVPTPNYVAAEEPEPETIPEAVSPTPPKTTNEPDSQSLHEGLFKILGFDKSEAGQNTVVFYVNASKTIIRMGASGISKSSLYQLVPDPTWWEMNFPSSGRRGGMDLDNVQAYIITQAYNKGMFDESVIRGRGAWIDRDRVVIHSGDYLIVDGKRTPLGTLDTRYMYEQSNSLEFGTGEPLSSKEASRLMDVLSYVNWERPVNSYLLAGWCVVAPVAGALYWRPHIWITGGAGTGKSWILEHIVRPILGGTALAVQGDTSEAGIRQTLLHDALPVVFDEADTDGKADNERIQKILSIMRSASTSDGGNIVKGSAQGRAQTFKIRTCFAMGSIAVQAAKQADKSRLSVLGIKRVLDTEQRDQRWATLQKLHREVITEDFSLRLQARTTKLLPIILKNAKTFSAAAANVLGQQRTGDQVGTLIAGAFSLHSNKIVSPEEAIEWIRQRDWTEERGLDEQRDETQLLNHILEQMTRVETKFGPVDRTIGELIQVACLRKQDDVPSDSARQRLNRVGIKLDDMYKNFIIANTADWVRKSLEKTPWVNNHHKILVRLEGAEATDPVRFGSGVVSRGVMLPIGYVID